MKQCNTCFHRTVCGVAALEKTGAKLKFGICEQYAPEGRMMPVDEDMALALCAGAAACEIMASRCAYFTVGGHDQRGIPFHDAARGLRKAGEAYLEKRR